MHFSIVCIGDELLDGRVRDGNAPTLGAFLDERGHDLVAAHITGDAEEAIVETLQEASDRADTLVVTGGLGPTRDDRTRSAAAQWAGVDLQLDEEVLERLERRFEERGYTFTDNNRRQCYFPAGARVLDSEVGTASGFVVERDGVDAWFFPGVPREFRWFLETYLQERLDGASPAFSSAAQMSFLGLGESGVETRLSEVVSFAADRDVAVSYLADAPIVTVQVRGGDESAVDQVRERVLDEIGDWLVTEGGRSLSERVGERLAEEGQTLTTAESCTAGWLSKLVTDVPGSSAYFEYGFVTYANQAKMRMLGVRRETLESHGAVSPETVSEMAAGAADYAGADFGLAISGIAGPSGGTPDKPVGTVVFGLATPDGVYTRRLEFPARSRDSVRRYSVKTALGLLIWYLDGRLERHSIEGPYTPDCDSSNDG